jgi:DNA-binding transcriptional MerR regulator/quercetin dioxygenase-like cupin family protein
VSGDRAPGPTSPAGRRHPHAPAAPAGDGRSFRIGEAARAVGVSPSALRMWERQGLVRPSRTAGRYRQYTDSDLALLGRVRRMRQERVSAPGIRRLLAERAPLPAPDDRVLDGRRLREARVAHGLSLGAAAAASGLSSSFISALERNTAGASVAALQRLTSAYGTTLLELIPSGERMGRLVRPAGRPTLEITPGVRIEQLAAGSAELEPQLFILAPGATSDGAYSHAGEEFLFVLDGAMTVWVGDDERYRLARGDALSFPSTLPHRWRNDASRETRLLWINTPPTF